MPPDNLPNPEARRRMVDDAMKRVFGPDKPLTPNQTLILRAEEICDSVDRFLLPILRAACQAKRFDLNATQKLVANAYRDKFNTWSKDELLFLAVLFHTDTAMLKIEENEKAGLYDI